MDIEDEETVLENSPLDNYLKNVSQLEFTKYKNMDESYHDTTFEEENIVDGENQIGSSIFCQNEYVSQNDMIKAISVLFECIALNDRDKYILHKIEEYTSEQLNNILFEKTTKLKSIHSFILSNMYYFIAFLIALISLPMPWLFFFSHYEEVFVLALLAVGGLIYIILSPKQSSISTMLLKELVSLSENTEDLESLIKKSINHIREVDIVMNGYFNTSIHKSFLRTNDRDTSKCKKLKKLLYDKLFEGFLAIRSRERIIIQNTGFRDIDVAKDEYLAEMSLNVVTDLLKNENEVANDDAANKQSTFDIESVKRIIHLFREQCSEFIYSCILALHSMDTQDIREIKSVVFSASDVNKTISNICKDIEKMLESSVEMLFSNHIPETSKSLEMSSKTEHDYIHSAKLNLHSAIYRLNDITEALANTDQSDSLTSSVNQFHLLLENAKSCVNEIASMKKTEKTFNETEEEKEEITNSIATTKQDLINTPTEPPDEIGDRLIEGTTEGIGDADISPTNDVDLAKPDVENSKKLMRELKCILSVKDSPLGLVPFPLDQSLHKNISEIIETEETLPPKTKEIKSCYDAKEYYGDTTHTDHDSNGTSEGIRSMHFQLPTNFLSQLNAKTSELLQEDVFGEAVDDELSSVSDDVVLDNDDVIS